MVKILSIGIARLTDEEKKNNNGEPVILSQAFEVSEFGFFQRGGVREMLTFFTRTFVKRTGLGKRQCVEHEGHLCHVQMRANGLASCIITDQDYPSRVAFSAAQDLLRQFEEKNGQVWKTATANAYDSFDLFGALCMYISDRSRLQTSASMLRINRKSKNSQVFCNPVIFQSSRPFMSCPF